LSWRASSGIRSWLLQRLSAVYIVGFLLVFLIIWGGEPVNYFVWRAWVAHPLANVTLFLFLLALFAHAWVGGRDVVVDYVKSAAARYVLLIVFGLGLVGLTLWSLRIVLLVTV
jgi:succinate dehydrogenase / fumarate reductase membrane anchor subunit